MQHTLYNPFLNFDFLGRKCFLSGTETTSNDEVIEVFPEWLMREFNLSEQPFKLLDENYTTYGELKLPCSLPVKEKILILQNEIKTSFHEGFTALQALEDWKLFYWSALIGYGLIYTEVRNGLKSQQKGEVFDLSPALIHKFKNLHFFLQGLIRKVDREECKPFSLFKFKVKDEEGSAPFEHRNEINTMTFSLRIKDMAIIICFQDNEANSIYHHELLQKFLRKSVDAKQFQEINAKIFYSNYLYNQIPEYDIMEHNEVIYFSQGNAMISKAPFDEWVNKTYAQVLEAFWKPWNITLMDILKDPQNPISVL